MAADELRIAAEQLDEPALGEGDVERLPRIQARVAQRRVVVVEVALHDSLRAAEALGDVLAGELEVDAARPRALGQTGREEALDLGHDVSEAAGLVPRGG